MSSKRKHSTQYIHKHNGIKHHTIWMLCIPFPSNSFTASAIAGSSYWTVVWATCKKISSFISLSEEKKCLRHSSTVWNAFSVLPYELVFFYCFLSSSDFRTNWTCIFSFIDIRKSMIEERKKSIGKQLKQGGLFYWFQTILFPQSKPKCRIIDFRSNSQRTQWHFWDAKKKKLKCIKCNV